MILVTPKYPDIHPFAYKATSGDQEIPWGHLQIIGGRQLVAFDHQNNIIGCVDLALTKDVKVIRMDGITSSEVSPDGGTVKIQYRKPNAVPSIGQEQLNPRAVAGTYGNRRTTGNPGTKPDPRAVTQGDGYGYDPDYEDDPDDHIERDYN